MRKRKLARPSRQAPAPQAPIGPRIAITDVHLTPLPGRPKARLYATKVGMLNNLYPYTLLTDPDDPSKQYVKVHQWSRPSHGNGKLQYDAKFYEYHANPVSQPEEVPHRDQPGRVRPVRRRD